MAIQVVSNIPNIDPLNNFSTLGNNGFLDNDKNYMTKQMEGKT